MKKKKDFSEEEKDVKTEQCAETSENETNGESEEQEEEKEPADPKDKAIEELNDKYKRLFAEFDNFRKRTEQEKSGMFAEGEKAVLLKTLPLIDNFERALQNVPDDREAESFAEGVKMIYKQFMDSLTEIGVAPIEATGKEFDANLHNAVMHVDDDTQPENTVVEEFQKGYMFKDKVLRYAMVKVAN